MVAPPYEDPNSVGNAAVGTTKEQEDQARIEAKQKMMTDALQRQFTHLAEMRLREQGKNPLIESALGGATWKFGVGDWTIDTEIPFDNKKWLPTWIGMGDQMQDVAAGVRQAFQEGGLAEDWIDIQRQNDNENILRHLYGDEYRGTSAKVGAVVGAVSEPIGLLLPGAKAGNVYKAFATGIATGALYGSGMYVDGNESRLTNAAVSAGLMGPMSAGMAKYFNHVAGSTAAARLEDARVSDIQAEVDTLNIFGANQKAKIHGKINKRYAEQNTVADETLDESIYGAWYENQISTPEGAADFARAEAKVSKEAEEATSWGGRGESPRGRLYSQDELERATAKAEAEAAGLMPKKRGRPAKNGAKSPSKAEAPTDPNVFDRKSANKKAEAAKKARIKRKLDQVSKRELKEPTQQDVVEGIEARAAIEGKRQSLWQKNWGVVDQILKPVVEVVGAHSKKVAMAMRRQDGTQHLLQQQWTQRIKPFQDFIQKLGPEDALKLQKLISNGGMNKATMSFIQSVGGAQEIGNAKAVKEVLNEILGRYKSVGYKMGEIPDYFPLAVKDLEGLSKKQQGVLDKLYARTEKNNKGKSLSPNQKAHIAEHYFTFERRYSRTSSSLNERKKRDIADDDLQFYHTPQDTLMFYIHSAAEDIAKREFFRGFGHKPGKKGLDTTGADIEDSISSLMDTLKNEVTDAAAQEEMVKALRARFSSDVNKTHRWVQDAKNASYALTLGNYWSAATQIGDLVFAFHKYGIKASVSALLGPKMTDKHRLGIEKAMAEMHSDSRRVAAKLADWSFKWSGFNKIDEFGKNVNINAALRYNKGLATRNPEEFIKKYEPMFGNETQGLLNELRHVEVKKNVDLSDNAHLMLWNELADTQPIGLSEMPIAYLKGPNLRMFYAYKTFALKQLNYMRNQLINEPNGFKKAYQLTKFGSMFVLANGTIDSFKDFMAGKDVDINDKLYDNLLTLVGTSKYAVDKSQGLGGILLQMMAPVPVTQAGKVLDSIHKGDVGIKDIVNQSPIFGKINRNYGIIE